MAARLAAMSAALGSRPVGLLRVDPGARLLAHEAEQRLADRAEVPCAVRVLQPLPRLPTQGIVGPPIDGVVAAAAIEAAGASVRRSVGLKLGVFPGDLCAFLRNEAALTLELGALPGDLLGSRLAPRGGLLLDPIGMLGVEPLLDALVDPLVAGVENVVDPLAQALEAAAGVVKRAHAPCVGLLFEPITRPVAVVAAELDVGAAAGHVGGDRHRAGHAGLGDDHRLLLVVARIEHLVGNGIAAVLLGEIDQVVRHLGQLRLELVLLAGLQAIRLLLEIETELADVLAVLQQPRQDFRLLDRHGADEDRLAATIAVGDLGNDGARFLLDGAIDLVVLVGAIDRPVGRDLEHVEPVDVQELVGFRQRRAGHAGELLVEAEIVLEGDGGERLVLGLDLDVLLGLQRLVQPLRVAPSLHHAAGELVDDDDLVALHDVVPVAQEELVGLQRLAGVVHDGDALDVVERAALQQVPLVQHLLQALVAGLRERDLALLLVDLHQPLLLEQLLQLLLGVGGRQLLLDLVVLRHQDLHQLVDGHVEIGTVLDGAGNDQRRARLVDQDRVDLVDDRVGVPALHHLGGAHLHVVAQVVEAQLVVGGVGDVAGVLGAPLIVVELVHDDADAEPEELVDAAHPLGVALGQVVVDRHDVHALAGERVEIDGERGDQRLALARLHLRDLALVQHHAADQLHVEMALAERALGRLAHGGEGRHQQVVERDAVGQLLAESRGARPQLRVREALHLRLERIDGLDMGPIGLELAIVRSSEDLGRNRADRQHAKGSSHPGAMHWEPSGRANPMRLASATAVP